MPEKIEIQSLVIESVRRLADDFEIHALQEASASTSLYGANGALDSMALVNLIADLEDEVAAKYQCAISLADERAMSAKRSPYQSIDTLTEAIIERLA